MTVEQQIRTGKRDRDEVFVEYTKSVCPVCKVVVDAQVNIRSGKVYLRKRCRDHGWFEALVYGDAQAYLTATRFNKPGTIPLAFQTEVVEGCPSDCGLCPEQKQHACLGIIEVNTACNLACPICFADSGQQPDGKSISVYLQFDGLEEATHRAVRGADLRAIKQQALDNCSEAGLTVALATAVERDVNEHEVGAILRFGVEHPAVRSVVFQPVTHSGRHVEFNPLRRLTNSDVIEAIAEQCPDWLRADDFVPVPCCFPTCRSITYLIAQGGAVVPIPRLLDVEDYLDYLSNRVLPDAGLRAALEKLWSASAFPGTATSAASLAATGPQLECAACGIDLPQAVKDLGQRAFMVVVQDFQDPYTLNVKQLMKCCVEEITPDGRLIPFCAYNSVGYREQVRTQMSGVPVADVVPNATELAPILADSPYGSKIARNGRAVDRARDQTNVGRRAVPR